MDATKEIHAYSGGGYGSPRGHPALVREATRIGRKRVERLMRVVRLGVPVHAAKASRPAARVPPRPEPGPTRRRGDGTSRAGSARCGSTHECPGTTRRPSRTPGAHLGHRGHKDSPVSTARASSAKGCLAKSNCRPKREPLACPHPCDPHTVRPAVILLPEIRPRNVQVRGEYGAAARYVLTATAR
ncbi:IS3 family transposase [Streptomyces sp. NPDC052000]|uniref:IS3 family transposase n=1 Tax=Streptomyces sp. NPDC052000 TaxID=3155676 RepID=UPI00344B1C3F